MVGGSMRLESLADLPPRRISRIEHYLDPVAGLKAAARADARLKSQVATAVSSWTW